MATRFIAALLATGMVATSTTAMAADYTIRFASALAPEMNHSRSMELFKKEVEAESKGRVGVELFFGGSLGGTKELLDQVKAGTIQMSVATTGFMTAYAPKLGVLNFPFLFKSREAAIKLLDGPFGQEVDKLVGAVGFKALGFEEVGWRNTINRLRPIAGIKDMQGMKIRLQPIRVHVETYRLLGANPVAMDFKELYTALQQGVIDAMEANYQNVHDQRFYEVAGYLSELPLFYDVLGRWINKPYWDALPADMKAVVEKASAKAVAYQRDVAEKEDAEALQKMIKAGVKFNKVDPAQLEEFRKTTAPIYQKFESEFGKDLMDTVLKAARG